MTIKTWNIEFYKHNKSSEWHGGTLQICRLWVLPGVYMSKNMDTINYP